jgi:uncharacterized delta-60 repeat protein
MHNLIDRLEPRQHLASAGTPDASFGTNGRATGSVVVAPAPAYDESKLRAAIDNRNNPPLVLNDGRVLAFLPKAYGYGASAESLQPAIVRFRADGQLDTSWGDRGFATLGLPVGSGSGDDAAQMKIDALGRVLVVAMSGTSGESTLARLTPTGKLDTTFSGDGKVEVPQAARFVGVDSKSRPVLISRSGDAAIEIRRFTTAGRPDAAFDADGVAVVGALGDVKAVTLDAADRIVYAAAGGDVTLVTRILTNGAVDVAFGNAGTVPVSTAFLYDASALFARSDGDYTFVTVVQFTQPVLSIWRLTASVSIPSIPIDLLPANARNQFLSVQFGMARDDSFSVFLTPEPFNASPSYLTRVSSTGTVLTEATLALPVEVSGLRRTTGPAGFRRDGSPVAVSMVLDPPVPNQWGPDRNGRVTGLVAWRVGGGIDGGVKLLPRMRVKDVLTVGSDGQPVFSFGDVAGNFAGRADRQGDGTYRARAGTLAGTYAAKWSVAYGRAFANYGSIDYTDGDGIALNATVLEQNGTKKTFGSEDSTWDSSLSLLPRGYATSQFQTDYGGGNVTNLYTPSGRVVQRAAEQSKAVFFTLVPQRTSDNAFATPIDNFSGEDGDIGNYPAGIMLRSPSGARLTSWGTRGANQGGATPWFADSRGRLLAFTADKKSIVRYTSRGAIDSSFRAVFAQGWNLDIDSRDRIVAWRVLQNAGTATGDVQVRRFNADGSADATFGTNGLAVVDSGLAASAAGQAYVDAADNVVVVSIERTGSQVKWSATKLRGAATAPAFAASTVFATGAKRSSELASVLNQ